MVTAQTKANVPLCIPLGIQEMPAQTSTSAAVREGHVSGAQGTFWVVDMLLELPGETRHLRQRMSAFPFYCWLCAL